MKKYKVVKFFNDQELADYFDNRMDALHFAVNAARSIFSGPVFLLSDPLQDQTGAIRYQNIEEVRA